MTVCLVGISTVTQQERTHLSSEMSSFSYVYEEMSRREHTSRLKCQVLVTCMKR